jgi:hypothetical protein
MFYYVIHNYIFTKSKSDESKYIKTLVCGSLLYIITHAFINEESNQLYPYLNYIFCIILTDIIAFSIKEKFINMDIIDNMKNKLPNLKKNLKKIIKNKKENFENKEEKVSNIFIRQDKNNDYKNDKKEIYNFDKSEDEYEEIVTESLFHSDFNIKSGGNINSELIEYSDESSKYSTDEDPDSIEINLEQNLIST